MALQKQVVGLKAGNMDGISAPLHVAAGDFVRVHNATRVRGGEWVKRQGMTSLATTFSGYERIASVGSDLVAYNSSGKLGTLGANGMVIQGLPIVGKLYTPTVTRFAPGSQSRIGCASSGLTTTFASTAWSSGIGYTGRDIRTVEEISTSGQELSSFARETDVPSVPGTSNVNARIIVTLNYIFYIEADTTFGLRFWTLDRSTRGALVSGSVLYADCVSGRFDAIASTSKTDRIVLAYARDAAAGLRIVELNAANGSVTLGPTADATNVTSIGIARGHDEADGFYWVATADVTNGVRRKSFTTAALTAAASWTVIDASKLAVTNVAAYSSTLVAYDNTASSVTSVYQGTTLIAQHAYLASQYIESGVFVVLNPVAVDPAYYVMGAGTNFWSYAMGRFLGGSAPTAAVLQCALSDFYSPATGQFVGTVLYQASLGFLSAARVVLDRRALSVTRNGAACASGTDLFIPCGPLMQFDGARYADAGPMSPPRPPTLVAGTAGALTASGTYSYQLVVCRVDAAGKLWRSPPSAATSITVGATTPSVTVTDDCSWTSYAVRNAAVGVGNGIMGEYYIEIYRINPGTTTARLVAKTRPWGSPFALSYIDGATDATVLTGEQLYTNEQVKENVFPPSLYSLCQWQNRLVGVSAEDRSKIWYSKEFVSGLGVGWNSVFSFETLDEYGAYYAVASLDDKLILFKENAIYMLSGQGPDTTGAGAFVAPVRIATNVGTRNPLSVVRVPDGVMFQGQKGIYLISRSLEVSFIGAPVSGDATTGITNPITSAVAVPDKNEVRFTFLTTPGTAVYNWFFQCWSAWRITYAVSAVLRNGLYYQLTAAGACKYEDAATFADDGVAVSFELTTGWISLAGLQGAMRVYALRIFGFAIGAHTMAVKVEYDQSTTGDQDLVTAAVVPSAEYQWEARPTRQKCNAIRFAITDTPTVAATETFRLRGLALLVGMKPGFLRRNPNNMTDY